MHFMGEIANLTIEQQERFYALKDEAGLDAFLSEVGLKLTDGEKAQALSIIENGKLPLSDAELDAATGGSYWSSGAAEGRTVLIGTYGRDTWIDVRCLSCNARSSMLARDTVRLQEYYDCKCYACGRQWSKIVTGGFTADFF